METCGIRPATWTAAQEAFPVRLFGPLAIARDGVPVVLPASRKLRALLAYLALAPHPVGGAGCANSCGMFRTILGANCAGA